MKQKHISIFVLTLITLLFSLIHFSTVHAQTPEAIVRAVLFYSPSCPHCHQVIQQDLPPLFEKYAEQLDIVAVDISTPDGQSLYQAAVQHFNIPENRLGVPTMIIDDVVLVGSLEIPEQFPELVAKYLNEGGIDWPDIPNLNDMLPSTSQKDDATNTPQAQTDTETPTPSNLENSTRDEAEPELAPVPPSSISPTASPGLRLSSEQNSTWRDKLMRDPAGNILAVLVLIGMLVAFFWAIILFQTQAGISFKEYPSWLIPLICIAGAAVAAYLSYVETAQVTAICGPIGDCNTVQQSEYARLFGILPIGVLGLIGYLVISIAWGIARYARSIFADVASLALLAFTLFGTLFSVYLTFLEPFVIGATCAWCLTSAILMTVLMLFSIRPAKLAYKNISTARSGSRSK